jgi:hypothetical protein
MTHIKNEQGEYQFSKTFAAEEGEYQYKLRLGPGDWWVCDDSKPKVDDGTGNQNNLVVVKPEPSAVTLAAASSDTPHEPARANATEKADTSHEAAPSMPQIHIPENSETDEHSIHPIHSPPESEVHSPLMQHENLAPPGPHRNPDDPPLLRHESVTPDSHEQNHAPLFRHESMAIDDKRHGDGAHHSASPTGRLTPHTPQSPIPEEADPNDPTLEKFPTDHKGIMEHLNRAAQTLPSDQTAPGESPPSPQSAVGNPPQTLSSVREDEEEGGASGAEVVPDGPMTPPMTPKEVGEDPLDQLGDESGSEGEKIEGNAASAFTVM